MMRKNILFSLLVISLTFVFVSCSEQGKQKSVDVPEFCAGDTADVLNLATKYLEHLKNKEFEQALAMVYHIEGDEVFQLTKSEKEALQKQYQLFPVLDYRIDSYTFTNAHNTEVRYTVTFFEKTSDSDLPNTMAFSLKPQRINAVWCLSILNRSSN